MTVSRRTRGTAKPLPKAAAPRRRAAAPAPAPAEPVLASEMRHRIEYLPISDIIPYEFNARKNAEAIQAVKKSIEQFSFAIPVVIDGDNNLIAGHTRVEAAKLLNMPEVPTIRLSHLSEAAVKAFRLIDNKVASIATWDTDLLAAEMQTLRGEGFDMLGYGWSQDDIDCMNTLVSDDCLTTDGLVTATEAEETRRAERRAPTQTRLVVGEFTLFVPATSFRNWASGMREAFDFNEEAIAEEIKRRLGILE